MVQALGRLGLLREPRSTFSSAFVYWALYEIRDISSPYFWKTHFLSQSHLVIWVSLCILGILGFECVPLNLFHQWFHFLSTLLLKLPCFYSLFSPHTLTACYMVISREGWIQGNWTLTFCFVHLPLISKWFCLFQVRLCVFEHEKVSSDRVNHKSNC